MIEQTTIARTKRQIGKASSYWSAVRRDALAWVRKKVDVDELAQDANPLRIADIFCGCGGLTLGTSEAARRAGRTIDVRLAVDTDPAALAVYRANFDVGISSSNRPVEDLFDGALGTFPTPRERDLADKCGKVQIMLAGAPCQGHSDLNNSTRRNDPRNRLYLCAARAIEVLRPEFAFIENVPSVVHDSSDVVGVAKQKLRERGYHVTTAVVFFRDFGLPQRRRRHILLASLLPEISIGQLLPPRLAGPKLAVGTFIKDLLDEPSRSRKLVSQPCRMTDINRERVAYLFKNDLYDLPDSLRPPCHRDKPHTYQSVYGRMRWSEPTQTITSGFGSMGQGRYVHPRRQRLITPHEASRIQGFPDFFDFDAAGGITALRTMIGNAVPPPLMISLVGKLLAMKLV